MVSRSCETAHSNRAPGRRAGRRSIYSILCALMSQTTSMGGDVYITRVSKVEPRPDPLLARLELGRVPGPGPWPWPGKAANKQ